MSTPTNDIDQSARLISPDGLPLAIIVISSIFFALSLVTVTLRTFVRIKKGILGLEDVFMVIGTIAYIPATGLAIYGCCVGLGRMNEDLNLWQQSEAIKYYLIWILVYVVALATVKSSVCITIRRIASIKKPMRITVWVLLAVTWASFLVTFAGTLAYCQPVSALWTGQGHCASAETFLVIAHTATVSTILTDMALVVVPAIILWNTQMKRQAKLQAFGLLSFASLASIITMIRIPFVNKFESQTNLPFWVAHIVLCSNVETGIGCFASSLPALRHFFSHKGDGSSDPNSKRYMTTTITAGGRSRQQKGRDSYRSPTEIGFSLTAVHHGRDKDSWEQIHDGASDKSTAPMNDKRIYADRTYTVDSELS
ncbi:integral membrane protein [Stemphylium lycopersici]|nr:integral membrane protein [Stemphylium lycopersici]